mmetsp:Transcript_42066/g.71136  ORF Transcript_42066/g.71136 Transcript_42066/m.71136 type:complete len:223 (+) Transcript_42066:1008-1676(+)
MALKVAPACSTVQGTSPAKPCSDCCDSQRLLMADSLRSPPARHIYMPRLLLYASWASISFLRRSSSGSTAPPCGSSGAGPAPRLTAYACCSWTSLARRCSSVSPVGPAAGTGDAAGGAGRPPMLCTYSWCAARRLWRRSSSASTGALLSCHVSTKCSPSARRRSFSSAMSTLRRSRDSLEYGAKAMYSVGCVLRLMACHTKAAAAATATAHESSPIWLHPAS